MESLQSKAYARDMVCARFADLIKGAVNKNEENPHVALLSEEHAILDYPRGKYKQPRLKLFISRLMNQFGPETVLSAFVIVKRLTTTHPEMFTDNTVNQIVLGAVSIQHKLLEDRRLNPFIIEFSAGVGRFHDGPSLSDIEEVILKACDWRCMVIVEEQVEAFHEMLDCSGYIMISKDDVIPLMPPPLKRSRHPSTPPRPVRKAMSVRELDLLSKIKREEERARHRALAPAPPPLLLSSPQPVAIDEYVSFMKLEETY